MNLFSDRLSLKELKILNYLFFSIFFLGIVIFPACSKKLGISPLSEVKSLSDYPNILLIIADDMGLDYTPGYSLGIKKPLMPNLNKLQSEGITYDNVWSTPICAPTRASIITGKYGIHNGVLNTSNSGTLPESEKTLQAYLDEKLGKVYSHALIGKWHLSNQEPNRPNQMGIDYFAGLIPGTLSDYHNWDLTINGQTKKSSDYITTKLTDLAINWIKTQDKPWFCWLAYTAPHSPFHLPPLEMHSQIELSSSQSDIDANPSPYYIAMIESIDFEMGRLFNSIPSDQKDNTLVIFLSDNGTPGKVIQVPYENNRSKGSLHQGGIHVPMIIGGPLVSRKGEREQSLISTTDLFSTIAEAAGVDESKRYNSQSFYSTLSNSSNSERIYNYSEILDIDRPAKSGFTIRNERYKLIVLDNNSYRFYDLINDPYEKINLMNANLSDDQESIKNMLIFESSNLRKK